MTEKFGTPKHVVRLIKMSMEMVKCEVLVQREYFKALISNNETEFHFAHSTMCCVRDNNKENRNSNT